VRGGLGSHCHELIYHMNDSSDTNGCDEQKAKRPYLFSKETVFIAKRPYFRAKRPDV